MLDIEVYNFISYVKKVHLFKFEHLCSNMLGEDDISYFQFLSLIQCSKVVNSVCGQLHTILLPSGPG